MKLFLRNDLDEAWQGSDPFAVARTQQGELFRAREGRRTLRFEADGRSYFLKYHGGIGWGEIGKNLLQLKMPVFGAEEEFRAIEAVSRAGLDTLTVAGFGVRGANPARQESFLVTDDLVDTVSLEALGEAWLTQPHDAAFRRRLIDRVAAIVRDLHGAGVNHRDLYLGHFLMPRDAIERLDADAPIYLIDLHRSQVRRSVPLRWRIKDLGGLYFSIARYGFTRADLYRFVRIYSGRSLRDEFVQNRFLWRRVRLEAERIYRRYYEKPAQFPLQFSEHPGKDI